MKLLHQIVLNHNKTIISHIGSKTTTDFKQLCSNFLKLCIILGFISTTNVGCDDTITPCKEFSYSDLANKLTDLEVLAILPDPGEKTAMWSSYNRESSYNEISNTYENWDANNDGVGYIRKEGDNYVLAEMEGPGCIWRIWSARAEDGHVKIYLDGNTLPAVDLPFKRYFDGTQSPFNFPELVYNNAAKGSNNYVPISYQMSCKIVAEPNWGKFYHFNYTTFPKGTTIQTFDMDLSQEELNILLDANNFFGRDRREFPYQKQVEDEVQENTVGVDAGDTLTLADISGQYAIKAIKIKMDSSKWSREEQRRILRKIVFQIKWDNELEPSVWSPLGDFFGTAPGVNEFKTLPVGMTDEVFYSNWYMPFSERAQLEVINEDDVSHELGYEIIYGSVTQPIEKLGRFHAKWHRDLFLLKNSSRWPDWTVLITQGKGRFVGMMLNVWHPRGVSCWGDAWYECGGWWGEGDEKFFVDGEKFPSTFGTGSEDYFGYAWGTAEFFEKAFHSQSMASKDNKGYLTLSRWHITDNIPFQKHFEFYLEKYLPNDWPTQYACLAYWYLSPGGNDPYQPVPLEERYNYELLPE